jgi:hypothetical protein
MVLVLASFRQVVMLFPDENFRVAASDIRWIFSEVACGDFTGSGGGSLQFGGA